MTDPSARAQVVIFRAFYPQPPRAVARRGIHLRVRHLAAPSPIPAFSRKEQTMEKPCACWILFLSLAGAVGLVTFGQRNAYSACCYFSAKGKDIEQPAQKVFLTWDPGKKVESFTVQPQF